MSLNKYSVWLTRVQNLVSILICQLIQLSELIMTRFLQALVSYFETEDIV